MSEHDKEFYRYYFSYLQEIENLYSDAYKEIARAVYGAHLGTDKRFTFRQNKRLSEATDKILKQLSEAAAAAVLAGTTHTWGLANAKNDEIARAFLKDIAIPKRFLQHNTDKLKAFQNRKTEGLQVSSRVWAYTSELKDQLESAIDVALQDGLSAQALSRNIKQYLKNPDALFRLIRNKHGDLIPSKAMAAFHPGTGTYKSAHKNALRLAGTEINMAYRESDLLRWQQQDFVIGYEIKTSPRKVTVCPLCLALAGKYPKNFVWIGWHPRCSCYAVPILANQEEFINYLDGSSSDFKGQITDMPGGFKRWVYENRNKIANADDRGKLPYFLKDNKGFVENITDEQYILTHFKAGVTSSMTSVYLSVKSFNLTPAETLAVRIYTEDYFQTINHALWNGIDSEEVQIYSRVLNRALDKFNAYEGQVFRGAPLTMAQLDEYKKYVKSGLPMPHPGFTSTSIRKNVAIGFTPNTMIYIKSKTGKDISNISNSRGESEILFKSNTKFKILSVGEGVEFEERVFQIIMEEI